MKFRAGFLGIASSVALAVGTFALAWPEHLLASKGVVLPNPAAALWVREVGVSILSNGMTLLLVRNHEDSPTLRAVGLGNATLQFGLFPIELWACAQGLVSVAGVTPNSILHVLLGVGFLASASWRWRGSEGKLRAEQRVHSPVRRDDPPGHSRWPRSP